MRSLVMGLAGLLLLAAGAFDARAQSPSDYSHGVEVSGNAATVWFRSNVDTQWVDVHYRLAGGGQQNFRMAWDAGQSRHEQVVSPVAQGQALSYSFTYNNGTPAHDTPWFDATIGGGDGGGGDDGGGDWNERTTFEILNQTRGRWGDHEVYWSIIGKSWETGQFVWVNAQGQQVPMSVSDNGALVKNGEGYTNYFHRLSDLGSVTIDPINSARILFSVGGPMYIKVVIDGNGQIGYAGANIQNPTDPNLDVYFDFGEMAILPASHDNRGIFVNTSRVDHFGFPLQLRVRGLGGYDETVGEKVATLTRDQVFSRFVERVPFEFRHLAQAPYAPYRIVAPAHGGFNAGQAHGFYLQPYIDAVWNRYRSQDLVFTLQNLGTFSGRVYGDTFLFTGGHQDGVFHINGKPNTQMVLLGAGLLADAANAAPEDIGTQLQIQAQVAAALNRHVIESPAQWYDAAAHYPAGQAANWYAWFWHGSDIAHHNLAYGFSYDDVGGHSPSLHTDAPTTVTFTLGW